MYLCSINYLTCIENIKYSSHPGKSYPVIALLGLAAPLSGVDNYDREQMTMEMIGIKTSNALSNYQMCVHFIMDIFVHAL